MSYTNKRVFGKICYGLLFTVIIPLCLWFWAQSTTNIVRGPILGCIKLGWALCISGLLLMIWAMFFLKKYGDGLPMNAFPTKKFVKNGPYTLFTHPIYWGFILSTLGFFIITKSPSGVWIITPIVTLSIVALIWGYEKIDLENRFPKQKLLPILRLPEKITPISPRDRIAAVSWVSLTIIIGNYFEYKWLEYNLPIYAKIMASLQMTSLLFYKFLPFIFILCSPFILQNKRYLRQWALVTILAFYLVSFINILWPESNLHWYTQIGSGFNGHLQPWVDIFAIPLCSVLICLHFVFKQSKILALPWLLIAGFLVYMTSNLNLIDKRYVPIHLTVYILSINYYNIWIFTKKLTNKLANSWHEWTFGRIRILNHGFYAGLAAFVGIIYVNILGGKEYVWPVLLFTIIIIICAMLWGQIIEGSEKLKRPFGYYGGLFGSIIASLIIYFMGYDVWLILATISVVMPWSQAIGRLRCLVNGCCHGSKTNNENIGIVYINKQSRVCSISKLAGEPLHPTPLYSIIWLFVVGLVLLSMWQHEINYSAICGTYLILTGIGRFVEEAYRGEVQTKIIKGLRLYQWTAILSVILGVILTTIYMPCLSLKLEKNIFEWESIAAATIGGAFTLFAMGIDFPNSNVRFSRLL